MHKLIHKIKNELEMIEDKVGRTNKLNCQEINYVKTLTDAWLNLDEIKEDYYPNEDSGMVKYGSKNNDERYISHWVDLLQNEDGTRGAYWTKQETIEVARNNGITFTNITEDDWFMTMNMIYSDYSDIAKRYGIDSISFYVDMAKQWLWDKDTKHGGEKLKCYYEHIVKH